MKKLRKKILSKDYYLRRFIHISRMMDQLEFECGLLRDGSMESSSKKYIYDKYLYRLNRKLLYYKEKL